MENACSKRDNWNRTKIESLRNHPKIACPDEESHSHWNAELCLARCQQCLRAIKDGHRGTLSAKLGHLVNGLGAR